MKIAPDLSDEDVDAVADLALRERLDGLIATNTTIDRGALRDPSAPDVPARGRHLGRAARTARARRAAAPARAHRGQARR